MNQSNDELNQFYKDLFKWSCRGIFLVIFTVMTYVVSRKSYNFSHWVPHQMLRNLGIPYHVVLWGEQNADIFLHFFGAMILTLLIYGAKLALFAGRANTIFAVVCFICVAAEAFQFAIGRGIESSDLLLGILGSFMAYLSINK